MTIIGDLFVSVRPETTRFGTELETKLKGIVAGGSGVSGALNKLGAGLVGGFIAASAASVKLASDFQSANAQIASNADISVNAANKIGAAFLSTAGTSIFSATQLSSSYATVAGQLGTLEGHALNARQALGFMRTASDLAEASNTNLGTATSTLAGIMQSFQIPLKGAGGAAGILFQTSRLTGVGIDQLGNVVTRLKARLGVAAPTLSDMGTLLVDLGEHGVKGSRGLLVVNTALNTLLSSTSKVSDAVGKTVASASKAADSSSTALQNAQNKLEQVQQRIAGTGGPSITLQQQLAKATLDVSNAQQNLQLSTGTSLAPQHALAAAQLRLQQIQEKIAGGTPLTISQQQELANAQQAVAVATGKNQTAQEKLQAAQAGLSPSLSASVAGAQQLGLHIFDTTGKFVGMGSVIAQLQPKLKGMTQDQQLQALAAVFGANANKALLSTVLAGPEAWNKAKAAVDKSNAAHLAAEKQQGTLRRQMQEVKATVTDLGIKWGEALIPKIQEAGRVLVAVTQFFEKNKAAAIALGVVLGGIATAAIVTFGINLTKRIFGPIIETTKAIVGLGRKTEEQVAPVSSLEDVLTTLSAAIMRLADSLPELDVELETTSVSFEALAEATSVAGPIIAESAEEAAVGVDSALGATGVGGILIAVGLAVTLLATHWKAVWKAIREAFHVVVAAFEADAKFFERIFDDIVGFVKSHWKLLAGILLTLTGPVGLVIALFLNFHKQIGRIIGDVVQIFVKFPQEVLKTEAKFGTLLIKGGKDLIGGLIKGIEFASPLYWIVKYREDILHFFANAVHWLEDAGKKLIEGLIHGVLSAPLHGLEALKNKVVGGIKSVFHIFSPSADTQPIGAALHDGLLLGLQTAASDKGKAAAAFLPFRKLLLVEGHYLEAEAEACGKGIMTQLAKGIESGADAIKVALGKVGLTIGVGGAVAAHQAAPGGKGTAELKHELLVVAQQQNIRLAQLVTATFQEQTVTAVNGQLLRLGFTSIDATLRFVAAYIGDREAQEALLLAQQLNLGRLKLNELREQTVLLRDLVEIERKPKQLQLKPAPGANQTKTGGGSGGVNGLIPAVLS